MVKGTSAKYPRCRNFSTREILTSIDWFGILSHSTYFTLYNYKGCWPCCRSLIHNRITARIANASQELTDNGVATEKFDLGVGSLDVLAAVDADVDECG